MTRLAGTRIFIAAWLAVRLLARNSARSVLPG
jgi:hypothetical protein